MRVKEIYYVYVLYSETIDKYYVGHTDNLEKRISQHNERKGRYTSGKGVWRLVYFEEFETRSLAMEREKYFKTGKGREYWRSKLAE